MRRRRRSFRESDPAKATTRLGVEEKRDMQERVVALTLRPAGVLQCPLSFDRFAEIWNEKQPQELVAAARLLDSDKRTEGHMGPFKSCHMDVDFRSMARRLSMQLKTVATLNTYIQDYESPLFSIDDDESAGFTWEYFASRISQEEHHDLNVWMDACVQINASREEALVAFESVLRIVNTAGQLHRLVPECVLFVSEDKRAKLAEQSKASAMPDDYFDLDHPALTRMNDFLTKCRLMPKLEREDVHIYERVSWAWDLSKVD